MNTVIINFERPSSDSASSDTSSSTCSIFGLKREYRISQQTMIRTTTIGTPIVIQPRNVISCPDCSRKPIAMALGGEPIGVPIPPILDANGMPRIIAFLNGSFPGKVFTTGIATAIISAVVAVLDIHIERNAHMTIIPSRTAAGLVPTRCSSFLDSQASMP